jgi:hypothetical protein
MVWKEDNYFNAEGNVPQQLHSSYLTAQESGRFAICGFFPHFVKKKSLSSL